MLIRLFILFFTIFLISILSCSATTIAAIPSRDGLVIVGDKRLVSSNGSISDGGNKIHQAGEYCAVMSTGKIVDYVPLGNQRGMVDFNYLIASYVSQNIPDSSSLYPHDEPIDRLLMAAYQEILGRCDKQHWLDYADGNVADTSLVFKYNPVTKQYEGILFRVSIFPSAKNSVVAQSFPLPPSKFALANVFLIGIDAGAVSKRVRPYDKLPKESWIERTLIHPCKTSDMGWVEAAEAGIQYVHLIHNHQPLAVGDTVDVLILGKNGIAWPIKNQSLDTADLFLRADGLLQAIFGIVTWGFIGCFVILLIYRLVKQRQYRAHLNSKEQQSKMTKSKDPSLRGR